MPCDDAPARAVQMAMEMRSRVRGLAEGWRRRGYDLALGVGVSQGYATLGRVGFPGRYDYAAIGTVSNVAARLSSLAGAWQILITQRVRSGAEDVAATRPVGALELRGISRPVETFDVVEQDEEGTPTTPGDGPQACAPED
jgi:class 3 adenylate cyclase